MPENRRRPAGAGHLDTRAAAIFTQLGRKRIAHQTYVVERQIAALAKAAATEKQVFDDMAAKNRHVRT